jgi:hypothetical protein
MSYLPHSAARHLVRCATALLVQYIDSVGGAANPACELIVMTCPARATARSKYLTTLRLLESATRRELGCCLCVATGRHDFQALVRARSSALDSTGSAVSDSRW